MTINLFKEKFIEAFNDAIINFLNLKNTKLDFKPNNNFEYKGILLNIKSETIFSNLSLFISEDLYHAIEDFHFDEVYKTISKNLKNYKSKFNNKTITFPNPILIANYVEFFNLIEFINLLTFYLNKNTNNLFNFEFNLDYLDDSKNVEKSLTFLKKTKGNTNFKYNLLEFETNVCYFINNKRELNDYFKTRNIKTFPYKIFSYPIKGNSNENPYLNGASFIIGINENFNVYF